MKDLQTLKVDEQSLANVGSTPWQQSTTEILVWKEKQTNYCLKWLNGKLNEEYKSFSALGNGIGLLNLMNISLGMNPQNT